jgi:type IV pilus assembly protein PilY1
VKTASNSCGNLTASSETVGNITITTDLVFTAASGSHGFGYVISGTNADGAHYHSGDTNFNYTYVNPSGGSVVECTNCNRVAGGTSVTYTPNTGASFVLQDPLYYAAKYGGFKDSNGNNIPDLTTEWDQLRTDGSPGADGIPDNYFLVSNPLGLENALNKVFLTILQTSSASSVATNSTSLQAGTKLYQARFNSNDWSGQVLAFPVNSDGTVSTTPDWDAGELMNPNLTPTFNPSNRVIITNTKGVSGSSPRGVALRWPSNAASPTTAEITSAMVTALNTNPATSTNDGRGSARLDWLRGVATNEGTAAGDFRRRQISKLGDIVNSNPNFVGPPNAGHGDAAYAAFRLLHTVTTPRTPIVYASANDGMLHGFNASNDPSTRGREVLAFMPSKALLKANKLTNQNYVHEYFVDGSPEVQDVCTTPHAAAQTCTGWATYLAGSQGFGGQGIFMLDVTSPTNFTEANAQSIVKWEFTDADDPDLGYSPGTPLIRRMANGKWAVIISGGYNNSEADGAASTTGQGVIFILFTSGPTGANGTWTPNVDYIKLTTGAGSVATPNGLAQPFSADINTDGIIDFLYAGDLLGNLWKFDMRSTTATTWAAAGSRVALFQARDASNNVQPITASAEGTSHVTGNGFMINFGTGKYLENTDVSPPGPTPYLTQSYYGIWDQNDNATISLQSTVTRSQLLQQQVLANVTTSAGTARVMSNNLPNWTDTSSPPLHKGWYMDFPGTTPPTLTPTTGERAVFQPTLINGRLIFTTLVPSTATCSAGGQSFLMVLDNMTGGRFAQSPFDTTGDGTINSSDLVTYGGQTIAVSGVATGTGGIAGTPTVIKAGTGVGGTVSTAGQYAGGTTGSVATMGISSYWEAYLSLSTASVANVLLDLGSNSLGRLNWREVTAD